MLFFLGIWSVLIIVCIVTGIALLNLVRADCFERAGDRLILSIWLGIVILSVIFLTASLIVPLSSFNGVAIASILIVASLLSHRTRSEILALPSLLTLPKILLFLTIALGVARLTTQPIIWFDTGLYHLGSIRWLSNFGAVPGLALINSKFGFTSSWFALAAPLTPKILGSQVGSITNAFVFLVAVYHFLIAFSQAVKNAKLSDLFIVFYSLITIPVYSLTLFLGSPILISFSPDVPVNFLIGVLVWSIIIISTQEKRSTNFNVVNSRIVPLVLSVGVVSIKLSALPLLPVAFLFYLLPNLKNLRKRLLLGGIILTITLIPMLLYGITTSGCPLYPSTFFCIDLPWSVTGETVVQEVEPIQFWTQLADPEPSSRIHYWFTAFWNWLRFSRKSQIMIFLVILSMLFSGILISDKNNWKKEEYTWLVLTGILGMIFILVQGPLLRFGLGYFIIIPCLFVAKNFVEFYSLPGFLYTNLYIKKLRNPNTHLISLALLTFSVTILIHHLFTNDVSFVVPPKLPEVNLIANQVNDVTYVYPANWTIRCWDADLPCSEVPIRYNIKLRRPSQGIGGGFVRVP